MRRSKKLTIRKIKQPTTLGRFGGGPCGGSFVFLSKWHSFKTHTLGSLRCRFLEFLFSASLGKTITAVGNQICDLVFCIPCSVVCFATDRCCGNFACSLPFSSVIYLLHLVPGKIVVRPGICSFHFLRRSFSGACMGFRLPAELLRANRFTSQRYIYTS